MKLTLLLLTLALSGINAAVFPQNLKIDLELTDVTLKEALEAVEQKTEYKFLYRADLINMDHKTSISAKDVALNLIMADLLKDTYISYNVINDNLVVLTPNMGSQPKKLSGTVKDATSGEPLPGVNVLLEGTMQGVITDVNGMYSIDIPNENAVLLFSFIGYLTERIPVAGQSVIDVALSADVTKLEEVVVVGYGRTNKATLTGSVEVMQNEELLQTPTANLSNSLVGRVTGVIATNRSGEPGFDGSEIFIRGVSTSGDNTPLYVIDGVPRTPSDFSQLSPNEIESISILKDAASSTVFGVRGANGVILVTTKRGVSGKTSITYTFNAGVQQPTRLMDFLDSYNYAFLYNEALRNEGKPEVYDADDLQKFKDGSDPIGHPNTDWYKEVFDQTPMIMQHNLSATGGGDKARYFVSVAYLDQSGLYSSSGFRRFNVRSNIDADVTKTTKITLDIGARRQDTKQPGTANNQIYEMLYTTPPIFPVRWDEDHLIANGSGTYNPVYFTTQTGYNRAINDRLTSQFTISQKLPFVTGLEVKGVFAADLDYTHNKGWHLQPGMYLKDPDTGELYLTQSGDPSLNDSYGAGQSLTTEFHVIYGNTFGKHGLNALLLYTQNKSKGSSIWGYRRDYVSDKIDQLFAGDDVLKDNSGSGSPSAYMGYVGRLNYIYDGKYSLEASFRYDGSDKFGPGHKWGFFPSLSASWVLSRENFVKNSLVFLTFAKIRGSYGKLGNDRAYWPGTTDLVTYPYLSSYNYGSPYGFGGSGVVPVKTLYEAALANPTGTWEVATKYDIGMETTLWDRIGFDLGYFYQRRSDILAFRGASVPDLLGATLPPENFMVVDNKGIEVSLSYRSRASSEFKFSIKGDVTFARNKLIDFAEPSNVKPWQRQTGHPLGQFFGYEAIGLFQSADEVANAPEQPKNPGPGDIRYADIDTTGSMGERGVIDGNDRTAIGGSNIPEIIYSGTINLSYKGIDLNILLQGAGKVDQYLAYEAAWEFLNNGNVQEHHLDRWTPDNPDASYPRLLTTPGNNNWETSSYWINNAAYLRVKNIELAYTLPTKISSKINAQNLRVYANVLNLLTFSKIKTLDPENGNDRGWAYPQMITYNIGLSVQF